MAGIKVTAGLETWSIYSVYLDHITANKMTFLMEMCPK